ncbi:MAG: c-type cytochrome [Verrucomicrobia bacterium]|jgi:mono/diheme cytochrome c family protein|nr:c-type cytochrome [Verrucomicrobiota bacterium]
MSEYEKNPGPNSSSRQSLEQAAMQDEQMQDVHAQLMREKEEPHEGFSPVPIFLMFLFAALCFWGGVYLVEYSGDYRWDAYSPDFKAGVERAKPPEISLVERGARIYRNQCAQCHQAEGNGVAGVYPPLAGADWVTGHPEVIARILINGLNGPIEVAGNTYNGNMPAFGPNGLALNDRDIAAVITYVRQEWGNAASEVTPDMINQYVGDYGSRTAPWKAEELREGLGPVPEAAPEEPEADGEAPEAEASDAEVAMAAE